MYEALMRRVIRRGLSDGLELSPELKEKIEALRNPFQRISRWMQRSLSSSHQYLKTLKNLIAQWQSSG